MTFTLRLVTCSAIAVMAGSLSSSGQIVRTWGGAGRDGATGIGLDAATNVYAGGRFEGTVDFNPPGPAHSNLTANGGGGDAFLCKYDRSGTFRWARAWGSNGLDRVTRIAVDGSGNVYAAGEFQNTVDFNPAGPTHSNLTSCSPNMNDAFLCKYDSEGGLQWARAWGGSRGDEAYGVAVDGSGNAYVVGDSTSPTVDFDPAGGHSWYTNYEYPSPIYFDAWLCKYDRDGNFQWARAWGGNGYDDCCAVSVDGLGHVYVAGMFGSTNNTCDFNADTNAPHVAAPLNAHGPFLNVLDSFLCRYDSDGRFRWARSWGSTNDDPAQGVAADGLGNVYVTGYFGSQMSSDGGPHDTVDFDPAGAPSNLTSRGGADAYLCKYASDGSLRWANTWGGARDDAPDGITLDKWGYVYVPGYFQGTVDFDPGFSVSNLTSVGHKDVFLSKFDSDGLFLLARSAGGPTNDFAGDIVVDGSGYAHVAGIFQGTVDFGALCGGSDVRTSSGGDDAFLCRIPTCCRVTVVRAGNGGSSLGGASPATQLVSLGASTQIVFTAADWHRIVTLASNSVAVGAAAGTRVFTQALLRVGADVSNEVTYALATPTQTGYTNVPTAWLTNWAEDAVISDPAFDVHAKYLIGLDPTTSNAFALKVESFSVAGDQAITVLRRTYAGGLSPDGMHGQLELQAADDIGSAFTNVAGTAVTGAAAFDGTGRRTYTNTISVTNRYIRGAIR